ncbi:uncharacterized protein LOC131144568 [Malania oleifera]|uniref:uncharacterized protein LOC131144568 n=1 Tax=Malania oleifera TaxID=397392 RepID=UPI0025AE8AD4|nr:uncharacterized protein LOC131144568 [Malania oleifera]
MMSNGGFDGQILIEKLTKLNNSQQSIESLSRWCISHRKKAKQIVETWDKLLNSSQRDQCVSFLYLANDILQNSRRKGSEFVNEFWKVLPSVLKHVYENGDEYGKKAVTRLVDIWEERKVFGSRGQSLKDEMLGKAPPPSTASNGKFLNPVKIVKRDAYSVRIKLAVGGLPERIVTAFQSVHDEHLNEETALNKCEGAVLCVGKLEKDVESTFSQGNERGPAVVDELQEQENILQQCVGQLESVEVTRAGLVSQLKEALQDQESKLEIIRTQLQVARGHIEQAHSIRQRLTPSSGPGPSMTATTSLIEVPRVVEPNLLSVQSTITSSQLPLTQPAVPFTTLMSEENKKAAAAAVAAKLAASTSSAQMLTSVLSSLVAEEAATMNGGLKTAGFTSTLPMFSQEKRPKLEKAMPAPDVSNSDVGNTAYISSLQQQPMSSVPFAPSTSMQPPSQASQVQVPFPPPPPPPPPLPSNQPTNQYVQSTGLMLGVMPYGFSTSSLPPPPPLPSHVSIGLAARPSPQPAQQPQPQQPQQQQQQQPGTGGYYRPPGIGFYGPGHQPTPPPVPRQ